MESHCLFSIGFISLIKLSISKIGLFLRKVKISCNVIWGHIVLIHQVVFDYSSLVLFMSNFAGESVDRHV